jgi:hypothetical protein
VAPARAIDMIEEDARQEDSGRAAIFLDTRERRQLNPCRDELIPCSDLQGIVPQSLDFVGRFGGQIGAGGRFSGNSL